MKNNSIQCHFINLKCTRIELVGCCVLQSLPFFCSDFPSTYLPHPDSEFSDLGLVGNLVKSRM